jgi:flagellar basal body P-ring protein FlgI
MSDQLLCVACGKPALQIHHQSLGTTGQSVLCGVCNEIYLNSDIAAAMKQKRTIALALANAGYTLSNRFEAMLTARDREAIIEKRTKERVERRNAELEAMDNQLNGSADYLFEPRE